MIPLIPIIAGAIFGYVIADESKSKRKKFDGGGSVGEPELLIDSHHGRYIPQIFYNDFDFHEFGLKKSDYSDLSDPNNEFYWDAWDKLLMKAKTKDGSSLYQEEDVWLVPEGFTGFDEYAKGGRFNKGGSSVDDDIIHIYKQESKKSAELLSKVEIPYKFAYGHIIFDIDDVFSETGSPDLKREYKCYGGVEFLGNINGKTANLLYYKNKEIKKQIEDLSCGLQNLHEEIRETVDYVIEQKGKPEKQLSVLYYLAKN